jgi:Holliday junction DNA helicase RuvA
VIASLRGTVAGRSGGAVIVDVNGVGYLVHASGRTLEGLGPVGAEATLTVLTQVREDAITLYGFSGADERDVFLMLTSVQGVGAKSALSMLTALGADGVLAALVAEDKAAITRADGVGPKIAARLVTELRDKAAAIAPALSARPGAASGDDEARAALVQLGFGKAEAAQLVEAAKRLSPAPQGTAALIGACLRISGGRQA